MVDLRRACLLPPLLLETAVPQMYSLSQVYSFSPRPALPSFLPPPLSLLPPSRHVLWLEVLQDVPWLVYAFGASPSFPLVLSRQASFNRDT